jgi:hypothetical protein
MSIAILMPLQNDEKLVSFYVMNYSSSLTSIIHLNQLLENQPRTRNRCLYILGRALLLRLLCAPATAHTDRMAELLLASVESECRRELGI